MNYSVNTIEALILYKLGCFDGAAFDLNYG